MSRAMNTMSECRFSFSRIVPILLITLGVISCSSGPVTKEERNPATRAERSAIPRHTMLEAIMQMMSVPYLIEGSDERGFDCSGFTSKIFSDVLHLLLPHSAAGQYALGTAIDLDNIRFGDLIFFQMEGDCPSHVGIYVGDGLFAHASVSHGVTISLFESKYYHERLYGIRRITD
jgi:cell wall-associated NlpC family hydrolase